MAEFIGLWHDIGRFEQFRKYKTFNDLESEDHAELSVLLLENMEFMLNVSEGNKQIIIESIRHHSKIDLPENLDKQAVLFSQILRDADKLDIYKVMMAHYRSAETGETSFITHDMADDGRVSVELAGEIMRGKGFHYSRIATLNDMKLFQVGMIYDLNFVWRSGGPSHFWYM